MLAQRQTPAVAAHASRGLCHISTLRPANRRKVVPRVVDAPETTSVSGDAAPGGYETSWYAWPEGYLGQSFSLLGKLEPRATALRDDIDKLVDFCRCRREECQFSEHTVTSAEDAAAMISAVAGAEVDMGLFKAGGSASFEMYQSSRSNSVSHNLVASFQQNTMLEKNQLALSEEAKEVLQKMGPDEFRARYGTHFVCGVGYRGAFIGSINVKVIEKSQSIAAGATFHAQYGKCSTMGAIQANMASAGIDCEVSVEWSKWGVDDESSLDDLEERCAMDNASFASMRQLAMQTADKAVGYPKLIKLRPYSTLPDYVEACTASGKPLPQLFDQEDALAYLTDRYRRAAYIISVLEREGMSHVGPCMAPVEATARQLIKQMEDGFTNPVLLQQLQRYLKAQYAPWRTSTEDASTAAAKAFVQKCDVALQLDLELFKYMQKPLYKDRSSAKSEDDWSAQLFMKTSLDGGKTWAWTGNKCHLAVASSGSGSTPFGGWWMQYKQQETFVQAGLYVVTLSVVEGVLQQVGKTQCFENTAAGGRACEQHIKNVLAHYFGLNTTFVVFKVGNAMSNWDKPPKIDNPKSPPDFKIGYYLLVDSLGQVEYKPNSSWAAICWESTLVAADQKPNRPWEEPPDGNPATAYGSERGYNCRGIAALRSDTGVNTGMTAAVRPGEPDDMVLAEIILKY